MTWVITLLPIPVLVERAPMVICSFTTQASRSAARASQCGQVRNDHATGFSTQHPVLGPLAELLVHTLACRAHQIRQVLLRKPDRDAHALTARLAVLFRQVQQRLSQALRDVLTG